MDVPANKEIRKKINVKLGYWELFEIKLNLRGLQKDVQVVRLFGHTIKVSPKSQWTKQAHETRKAEPWERNLNDISKR